MPRRIRERGRLGARCLTGLMGMLAVTLLLPARPAAQQPPVNGVIAEYWSRPTAPNPPNRHFSWPTYLDDPTPTWPTSSLPIFLTQRVEAQINNDWAATSPIPGVVPIDDFMVTYRGFIKPPATGTYLFSTRTDDGVRLWINDRYNFALGSPPNYNFWVDQGATVRNGTTVNMDANFFYPFRMEMYERGGSAVSQLRWRLPGTSVDVIIPNSSLFTEAAGPIAPPPPPPPPSGFGGGDAENHNGDNALDEVCGGSLGASGGAGFRLRAAGLLLLLAAGLLLIRRS